MPSAASVKIDKQLPPSAETALTDNGNSTATPLRQAITIIEHKIRNLEKRKVCPLKLPCFYMGLYYVVLSAPLMQCGRFCISCQFASRVNWSLTETCKTQEKN